MKNPVLRHGLLMLTVLALALPVGLQAQGTKDIVETAEGAGSFTTLLAALNTAGLTDALKGDGPFTVFAPTDAAFAKLPAGTVDALLADIPKLKSILLYHVVSGSVTATDVIEKKTANWNTLNGQKVKTRSKNGVTVEEANIVQTDIAASNGIIHVIDAVLIPKQ